MRPPPVPPWQVRGGRGIELSSRPGMGGPAELGEGEGPRKRASTETSWGGAVPGALLLRQLHLATRAGTRGGRPGLPFRGGQYSCPYEEFAQQPPGPCRSSDLTSSAGST